MYEQIAPTVLHWNSSF